MAMHDTYGGTLPQMQVVYRSTNRGATWDEVAEFPGQWSNLFLDGNQLYAMGTTAQNGAMVIRRSSDGGLTWTNPTNANNGLLRSGGHSTGPMPVVVHQGRIWRGFEDLGGGGAWPQQFRSFLISAPVGSDLLKSSNWTETPTIPSSPTWLDSKFNGWLEGNAVVTPDGELATILRANTKASIPEQAAIIVHSADGASSTFDPAGRPAENPADKSGFIPFPGGAKKFTIRRDPVSGDYWSLVNTVLPAWQSTDPIYIRNAVSLLRSSDLVHWETRCHLLFHPDSVYHAFQYLDWQFDGNDLVALSRTSWQGKTYHDANFITFHRIAGFRNLTMANSVPVDGSVKWPFPRLEVSGTMFAPGLLENGALAYNNRNYLWDEVPPNFAESLFTRVGGGVAATMKIRALDTTRAYVATTIAPATGLPGWISTGQSFCSNDTLRTRMWIYRRDLTSGQEVTLPQTTWSGTLVISPPKSGMVGWWRCESTYGNTAVADELFAFHGKPSAPEGPVAMGFGRFGSALRFNPGQHVDLGNVFPLTRVPFTISMWLRLDEGDTANGVPLSKMADGSLNGYRFEVNPAGAPGKIRFVATSTAGQLTSQQSLNDNLWHHVAVTLKPGGDQILYVDGVEQARCPAVEIKTTPASLRFGARSTAANAATGGFSGWLDEIQIYHTNQSASRILSSISAPPDAAAPPPVPVRVNQMIPTGPNVSMFWTAVPGQNYNIYCSKTMEPDSWELLDILTPQSEQGQFTVPINPERQAFFRIETQP